jgi:hypothetical protein
MGRTDSPGRDAEDPRGGLAVAYASFALAPKRAGAEGGGDDDPFLA